MKIKNDQLEHYIRINYKNQSYLHLSKLRVNDNDLVSVVDFLNKNPEIQEVDLSSNLIHSQGVETLIKAQYLTSLDISDNQIGDEGILLITSSMPNLLSLDVQANGATTLGACGMAKIVKRLEEYAISYQDNEAHEGEKAMLNASKERDKRQHEIKLAIKEAQNQRNAAIKKRMGDWDWDSPADFFDQSSKDDHVEQYKIQEYYIKAKVNKDFLEMLKIAQFYRNKRLNIHGALDALWEALQMMPDTIKIDDVKIDEFLNAFTYLDTAVIFSEKWEPILKALERNTTIKKIAFPEFDNDHLHVNCYLAELIAKTKTVESLHISTNPRQNPRYKLTPHHMQFIAYGMRYNSSIKELELVNQAFNAEAVYELLESLQDNPDTQINLINLNGSYIHFDCRSYQFAKSFTLHSENGRQNFYARKDAGKLRQKQSTSMRPCFFNSLTSGTSESKKTEELCLGKF